jgi:hypothetical protein
LLKIGNTLVSLDVIEKYFVCDLPRCKGICCVHGDSGAPLQKEEAEQLAQFYDRFKDEMNEEGRHAVEQQGTSVIDSDGDLVTPLIRGKECAYACRDKQGIYKCAIERAWQKKKIPFRKPVSCHLFPVRLREYEDYTAVNFEYWKDCRPALEKGREKNVRVYEFLGEALTRRFGKPWYNELKGAAKAYLKQFGTTNDE